MSSEIPNPKFQISTSTHQHISTSKQTKQRTTACPELAEGNNEQQTTACPELAEGNNEQSSPTPPLSSGWKHPLLIVSSENRFRS